MSKHKLLLHILALLAAAVGCAALVSAIASKLGFGDPATLMPFVFWGLVPLVVVFGSTVLLLVEFIRSSRSRFSANYSSTSLNHQEVKAFVQWCPTWVAILAIALVVTSFLLMPAGRTHWSSSQEFTNIHALAFSSAISLFCFISLPVLVSAAKMPGSFLQRFSALRNAKHLTTRSRPTPSARP